MKRGIVAFLFVGLVFGGSTLMADDSESLAIASPELAEQLQVPRLEAVPVEDEIPIEGEICGIEIDGGRGDASFCPRCTCNCSNAACPAGTTSQVYKSGNCGQPDAGNNCPGSCDCLCQEGVGGRVLGTAAGQCDPP